MPCELSVLDTSSRCISDGGSASSVEPHSTGLGDVHAATPEPRACKGGSRSSTPPSSGLLRARSPLGQADRRVFCSSGFGRAAKPRGRETVILAKDPGVGKGERPPARQTRHHRLRTQSSRGRLLPLLRYLTAGSRTVYRTVRSIMSSTTRRSTVSFIERRSASGLRGVRDGGGGLVYRLQPRAAWGPLPRSQHLIVREPGSLGSSMLNGDTRPAPRIRRRVRPCASSSVHCCQRRRPSAVLDMPPIATSGHASSGHRSAREARRWPMGYPETAARRCLRHRMWESTSQGNSSPWLEGGSPAQLGRRATHTFTVAPARKLREIQRWKQRKG